MAQIQESPREVHPKQPEQYVQRSWNRQEHAALFVRHRGLCAWGRNRPQVKWDTCVLCKGLKAALWAVPPFSYMHKGSHRPHPHTLAGQDGNEDP